MIVQAQSDMSEHETAADASANASTEQRENCKEYVAGLM